MSSGEANRERSKQWVRPAMRASGLVLATSLLLTPGCTAFLPDEAAATRILQSVAVGVDPSGAIEVIDGTAVYLDEGSGTSTSSETEYAAEEVVDDLPVRITTQYRTSESSGSSLQDLVGYSGRVEIGVTLENLTVSPSEVRYDAAGESRVTPALVGTPLSVAASAELGGVEVSKVVFTSEEGRTTNGVVSSNSDGNTVVQWATLLAPPQSEAVTTFQIVAEVEDITLPNIDIAVQAGLHTDLSFEGAVASAFDAGSSSELAMQQRAIALVTDVNDVLNRAGSTITEVRKNLNDTSDSLGVRAARQLSESTTSLSAEMQSVSMQLTSLQKELESTVTGTHSAMESQLWQLVASMNSMLGDTTGTPPRLIEGEGCAATVQEGETNGTLFSAFLVLAGQLDGYAEASESCRDEIVAEIEKTLGPEEPTEALCEEPSMTCALFSAKTAMLTSLADLVTEGQSIVDDLSTETIDDAIQVHGELGDSLDEIETKLDALQNDADSATKWQSLKASLDAAIDAKEALQQLRQNVVLPAIAEIGTGPGSMRQQQLNLADELCNLAGADPADIELLRAELVDTECDGVTPQTFTPAQGTLTDRLDDQLVAWNEVLAATDVTVEGSAMKELHTSLQALLLSVGAVITDINGGNSDLQQAVADLKTLRDQAEAQHLSLGGHLTTLKAEQDALGGKIHSAFGNAASDAEVAVTQEIDDQIRTVTNRVNRGRDAIQESYNATINGLSSTSSSVLSNARTQIDGQKAKLDSEQEKVASSLDERTVSALERINRSTEASTRDVEGASAMLSDSLNKVILDLGDPKVEGSGILGAMSASAAKADTADYQLALASQQAAGYSNVRSEDIATIMLRQAQFEAALESAATLPAFHLEVPAGATSQTIYTFHLGGGEK